MRPIRAFSGSPNCQSHLRAGSIFPLPHDLAPELVKVVVHTRLGAAVRQPQAAASQEIDVAPSPPLISAGQLRATGEPLNLAFQVEIV